MPGGTVLLLLALLPLPACSPLEGGREVLDSATGSSRGEAESAEGAEPGRRTVLTLQASLSSRSGTAVDDTLLALEYLVFRRTGSCPLEARTRIEGRTSARVGLLPGPKRIYAFANLRPLSGDIAFQCDLDALMIGDPDTLSGACPMAACRDVSVKVEDGGGESVTDRLSLSRLPARIEVFRVEACGDQSGPQVLTGWMLSSGPALMAGDFRPVEIPRLTDTLVRGPYRLPAGCDGFEEVTAEPALLSARVWPSEQVRIILQVDCGGVIRYFPYTFGPVRSNTRYRFRHLRLLSSGNASAEDPDPAVEALELELSVEPWTEVPPLSEVL